MNESGRSRGAAVDVLRVLVSVILLLTSMTTGVAVGVDAPTGSEPAPERADHAPSSYRQVSVNNSTVERHENPANGSTEGDMAHLSRMLSESLSDRLDDSSVTLNREQYDTAKRYVGPEYRRTLSQYFEVAAQTETESDDRLAEQFDETAETQERIADQLQRFNETQREYRQARREGNDTRAKQLARQLRRLAEEVNTTRATLVTDYSTISAGTAVDLSDAARVLNETVAQRIAEAQAIQSAEFTATELAISTTSEEASFLDPVRLRGRLTSNRSALANRDIQLEIGSRLIETRTDANGNFTVGYRPVTQPLGMQTLRVQYVPGNETNLQTSNDTVRVNISQVTPDVSVTLSPAEAEYNETVRITGEVAADGVAAPSAPLAVYLGSRRIALSRTTPDGEINESVRLSVETPSGDSPVRVVVGSENRSLGRAENAQTLSVRPLTPLFLLNATLLNQSGPAVEQRTVVVQGRLALPRGEGIEGQPIEISIDGVPVSTVETDETGLYETTVEIPAALLPREVGGEERIGVAATYAAEETIFEETTRASSVVVQAELLAVVGRNISASESLIAFLVIGSALALRRRYDRTVGRSDGATDSAPRDSTSADGATDDPGTPPIVLARRLLDDDRTDAAVAFAYSAVRAAAARAYDLPRSDTHWEFVSTYRNTSAARDATVDAITRLTALYERAAFDNSPLADQEASEALSLVESILDSMEREGGNADSRTVTTDPLHTDGGEPDSRER